MKDVSIIIVNWNTQELLKNCLDSIIESKPKVSFEIIVVDNGSTDGSIEFLHNLLKKKIIKKVIENGANLGFSKANNKGIKASKGEHVLLLNSDTEIKKGSIDELVNFANNNPLVGVIGSRLFNSDGSIQSSCFHFPTLINAIRQFWLGEKNLYDKYYPSGESPSEVDAVVGASMLITKKALKEVGLLNEKYFFFFEDLDYCRSIKRKGFKVFYLPSSKVVHYHGSTVKKVTSKDDAWKKLVPGSKIYHGEVMHYLINFVLWSGQKWQKFFKNTQQ